MGQPPTLGALLLLTVVYGALMLSIGFALWLLFSTTLGEMIWWVACFGLGWLIGRRMR